MQFARASVGSDGSSCRHYLWLSQMQTSILLDLHKTQQEYSYFAFASVARAFAQNEIESPTQQYYDLPDDEIVQR